MFKDIFQKIKLPLFIILFFVILILLWELLGLPPKEQLTEIARTYFDKYGLISVFVASIIEGTLLAGWYAPGGLIIFLGVILSGDPKQAILSVLLTIAGFMLAWTLNFFTGKYGWYRLFLKLGIKSSLEKAQAQFSKYGFKTIYLSYWEPNLASLVSTSAGIAQVPIKKFLIVSFIATVFWCTFWGIVAYSFGSEILKYLGGIFLGVMFIWILSIIVNYKKNLLQQKIGKVKDKEIIKLICFDLDETIITHSSWKNLNLALGISEEDDKKMYDEFISGHISYEEWNDRVLNYYLKHEDATREGVTNIVSRYTYNEGVRENIEYLKSKGYIIVLISGSIDILVSMVAHDLGIKYFKANNTFIFDDINRLQSIHSQGNDTKAKLQYLESFCEMLGVDIKECACVGDGANDSELFKKTTHGITFKNSILEKEAWKIINSFADLKNIF